MAEQVRIRRDSDDIASTHTGVAGELGYNTTDGTIHAYDGVTPGGKKTLMAEDGIALALIDPIPSNTVLGNPTGSAGPVTTIDISTLGGGGGAPTVNANSIYGNNTGSAAPGTSLSVAQAKTLLGFASTAELTAGLAGKANETVNIAAGAGLSGGGDLDASMSIELASIPANSLLANFTESPAIPVDHTLASLVTKIPIAVAGTPGLMPALPATPTGKVLDDSNAWVTVGGFPKTDVPVDIRDGFDGGQQLEIKKAASIVNPSADSTALLRATDRPALYFRNQWGGQAQLATHPAAVRWQLWLAQYGSAGAEYATNAPLSTKGTGTYENSYVTVQGTTRLATIPRIGLRTGTTAGSLTYFYYTQYLYAVPKADGSVGGFYLKAIVPRINLATVTSERLFYGMVSSGSVAFYNAAYETLANHIGFVRKAGSDDVYLSYRGASNGGEINLTTVNANLTWSGTVASPRGLVFILEMVRENPGTLYYEIYDVDNESASRVRGLVTPYDATYLPADTLGLTWMLKSCNNLDAASVSVWYAQVYLEQPL